MAAPKGNDFWKRRSKHGPDVLFESADKLREAVYEFIKLCEENPRYTVEQTTGKAKPIYDDLTGDWLMPEPLTYIPEKRPLTMVRLCRYLHVNEAYFRKKRLSPNTPQDIRTVIEEVYDIVNGDQQEGGLLGHYNANLTARLQGIAEVTKNEHTGPNGEPLTQPSPLDNLTYEQLYQLKHGKLPPAKK